MAQQSVLKKIIIIFYVYFGQLLFKLMYIILPAFRGKRPYIFIVIIQNNEIVLALVLNIFFWR